MWRSVLAESIKLRRRPAVWILGLIWLSATVLLGYALAYVFLVNAPPPPVPEDVPAEQRAQIRDQDRQFQEQQLDSLLPENLVSSTISGFPNLGGPLALILGSLAVGGEYGWGTLKTIVTQRPRRTQVLGGKLLAVGTVLVVFVALTFAGAAASSYVIAGLQNEPVDWPPAGELARAFGVGALIFALWGSLGAMLATLFRSTALAVGLGLVYALVLETLVLNLPIPNETFRDARELFPGQNSTFLANSFADAGAGQFAPPEPPVEPTQAALVIVAYTAAFVVVSMLVFRRRDVM